MLYVVCFCYINISRLQPQTVFFYLKKKNVQLNIRDGGYDLGFVPHDVIGSRHRGEGEDDDGDQRR